MLNLEAQLLLKYAHYVYATEEVGICHQISVFCFVFKSFNATKYDVS